MDSRIAHRLDIEKKTLQRQIHFVREMSNIVGTYIGSTNTPSASSIVTISSGPTINGSTTYPTTNRTTINGVTTVDNSMYLVAMPNQPGAYLLYQYPNVTNPLATATLNGNTLTRSDGATLFKVADTPATFYTQPPTPVYLPNNMVTPATPQPNPAVQTNPAVMLPVAQGTSQMNPNSTLLSPQHWRVVEPQHSKFKHHRRGKKAGKRKH